MSSVNGNNMYPSLPSVTAVSDMGAGYPSTTSAPASGLGSAFEGFEGRRYSGGRLQREAPAPKDEHAPEDMDMDDGSKTPRNAKEAEERPGSSSLDPALRSTPVPSQSAVQSPDASTANSDSDKSQENWVENIRVIESLRSWIRERIERQEFEGADEVDQGAPMHEQPQHDPQLEQHHDPSLEQHHEQHHDPSQDHEMKHDEEIAYPILKAEA